MVVDSVDIVVLPAPRPGNAELWSGQGSPLTFKRYTDNYTVNFLKFKLGLRKPATSVSPAEHELLSGLARGKGCIVEVGVFEAATSRIFCQEIGPSGTLFLVDPHFPEVLLERLLNVSFARSVAAKTVAPWRERVRFVRQSSRGAVAALSLRGKADLIFIDADKQNYVHYGAWAVKHLRRGGLVIGDNAYLFGNLLDDTDTGRSVRAFHETVAAACDSVCAPTPDGLVIGIKK